MICCRRGVPGSMETAIPRPVVPRGLRVAEYPRFVIQKTCSLTAPLRSTSGDEWGLKSWAVTKGSSPSANADMPSSRRRPPITLRCRSATAARKRLDDRRWALRSLPSRLYRYQRACLAHEDAQAVVMQPVADNDQGGSSVSFQSERSTASTVAQPDRTAPMIANDARACPDGPRFSKAAKITATSGSTTTK